MRTRRISKKSTVCSLWSVVCRRRQAAAGFTLLELMTVMVIMFILMGMSTLALRGVMRGAGISGAVANVRSVLTQARQQAIMNQQPTAVFFTHAGETNTMQILTSYGRVTDGSSGAFVPEVELPWSANDLSGSAVFNFRGGAGSFTGRMTADAYLTSGITWEEDDDVAFQLGAIRSLPDSIEFNALPSPPVVVFSSDGSARDQVEFELRERNVANPAAIEIVVDQPTGWIEITEPTPAP